MTDSTGSGGKAPRTLRRPAGGWIVDPGATGRRSRPRIWCAWMGSGCRSTRCRRMPLAWDGRDLVSRRRWAPGVPDRPGCRVYGTGRSSRSVFGWTGLCIAFSSSTTAELGERISWSGIGVGIGVVFSLTLLILADKCPRYITRNYANTTVMWAGIPLNILT